MGNIRDKIREYPLMALFILLFGISIACNIISLVKNDSIHVDFGPVVIIILNIILLGIYLFRTHWWSYRDNNLLSIFLLINLMFFVPFIIAIMCQRDSLSIASIWLLLLAVLTILMN